MKKYISFFISLIFYSVIGFSQNIELTNSVVVGGVTSSSARFWLRTTDPVSVNIELSENNSFTEKIFGVETSTAGEKDNTAIINVNGLKSDTRYFYRAVSEGKIIDSEERYFWTFPAENSKPIFSFAFGSCQQNGEFELLPPDEKSVFNEIIKHDVRFFLQLGDWGYPDTTDNFPDDNNFFASDMNLIRKSYQNRYNKEYPMDNLLKRMPVDYVYDDHDYMNNNSSALTSSYYVPYRPNDFGDDFVAAEISNPPGARENSILGYKENFPGYELVNETRGIYHKFKFGNAEFFALDLRSQKSPALEAFSKNESTGQWEFKPPEGHSILGTDETIGEGISQMTWLLEGLKNSTADWKFIISSVPFNRGQRAALNAALGLQNIPINIEGAPAGATAIAAAFELADSWTGFPDDSEMLLNFIEENEISNVIVLSGDSHNSALDNGENAGLTEIMSGNLDITNSRTVSLFESFGIEIWNQGGHGITTQEFNDAFGKITVYGEDSVKLSLIDEFGVLFAEYTVMSGNLVYGNNNKLSDNYYLLQNYPNPFNPSTTISFSIPEQSDVTLRIFDILGREIERFVTPDLSRGLYSRKFSAENLSGGVYFYSITAVGDISGYRFDKTKKMIFLR